jgi:hypothetical protein
MTAKSWAGRVCAAATVVSLALAAVLPLRSASADEAAIVSAPDNRLNLRASPNANAEIIIELWNNTKLHIIEPVENGWKKIGVDIMGDTGKPPNQNLVGFVNGKYLITDSVMTARAFRDGHADRQAWEAWFAGLSGIYRAGAEFWAGHRSDPKAPACASTTDIVFRTACEDARKRLTQSDQRRKSDPNYFAGWNAPLETPSSVSPEITSAAKQPAPPTSSSKVPTEVSANQECDSFAAHPSDTERPAGIPGVPMEKIDAPRAIAACRRAVRDQATDRAFFQLGRALEADKNYPESIRNFRMAAEHSYAEAEVNLGYAYEHGQGVSQDHAQAIDWYRKAADHGSARGRASLERMSKNTQGTAASGDDIITLVCAERRGPQYRAKIVLDLSKKVVVSQESGVIPHGTNMPLEMNDDEIGWRDGGYVYIVDRATLEMRGDYGGIGFVVIFWDCQLAGKHKI